MLFRLFGACATLALSTAGAFAADVEAPAPVFDWTGPYVGINAGIAFADNSIETVPDGAFEEDFNPFFAQKLVNHKDEFTAGVTAGHNWQLDSLVLGLEGDFNYLDSEKSRSADTVVGIYGFETKSDWFATVRPRLGWAVDNILLYVTGGLAVGDVESSVEAFDFGPYTWSGSQSKTKIGWTIGGGGEWALSDRWSIKGEYLWVDLGSDTYRLDNGPLNPIPEYTMKAKTENQFSVARIGLNFRF